MHSSAEPLLAPTNGKSYTKHLILVCGLCLLFAAAVFSNKKEAQVSSWETPLGTIGEDGLTDAQRESLQHLPPDLQEFWRQRIVLDNMMELEKTKQTSPSELNSDSQPKQKVELEKTKQTSPSELNSDPQPTQKGKEDRVSEEVAVGAYDGQIVFYFEVASLSTTTWGDFNPYLYLFKGILGELKADGYVGSGYGGDIKTLAFHIRIGTKSQRFHQHAYRFFAKLQQVTQEKLGVKGNIQHSQQRVYNVFPKHRVIISFGVGDTKKYTKVYEGGFTLKDLRYVGRDIHEAHGNEAFYITQGGGFKIKSSLSLVAGDIIVGATYQMFGRSEYLFGGWKTGPGGGNEDSPVNSGILQPGISKIVAAKLPINLVAYIDWHNMVNRKVICAVASHVNPSQEDTLRTQINHILGVASELWKIDKNWAILFQGVKLQGFETIITQGWEMTGIPHYHMYLSLDYLSYALLAPKCDVWMNQFGAGSVFWGIANGKPLLSNVITGMDAKDKEHLAARALSLGICPNCGKFRQETTFDEAAHARKWNEALTDENVRQASLTAQVEVLKEWIVPDDIKDNGSFDTTVLLHDSVNLQQFPIWILDTVLARDNSKYVAEVYKNRDKQTSTAKAVKSKTVQANKAQQLTVEVADLSQLSQGPTEVVGGEVKRSSADNQHWEALTKKLIPSEAEEANRM